MNLDDERYDDAAMFKVRPLRAPLGNRNLGNRNLGSRNRDEILDRRRAKGPAWKPRILDTARRSGLSPSHVSKIFTGTRRPSIQALEKIAAACRMTTDELLRRLPPRINRGQDAA